MDPNIDVSSALTSVAGIIALVIATVQLVKMKVIPYVPQVGVVPGWLWVLASSFLYTGLAVWRGYLEGDMPILLITLVLGLMASGVFEMATNFAKPLGESAAAIKAIRGKFSVLLVVALAGAMTVACAGKGYKAQVTAAYQGTQTALGAFQDTERALFAAKTVPELTEERHRAILVALQKAFAAQEKFGDALVIWRSDQPVPREITEWFTEAERVIAEVKELAPGSTARLRLAEEVIRWARTIVELAKVIKWDPPATIAAAAASKGDIQ